MISKQLLPQFSLLFLHAPTHRTIRVSRNGQKSFCFCFLVLRFRNHCTTQWPHHHCNNHRHHAIFLLALTSQTNQGHIPGSMDHLQRHFHTFFFVLRWSVTNSMVPGSSSTALSHIFCVFYWPGTNSNNLVLCTLPRCIFLVL